MKPKTWARLSMYGRNPSENATAANATSRTSSLRGLRIICNVS